MATKPAPLPGAEGLWTRRPWMRCAAVSGCLAMLIWIWGNLSGNDLETRSEEQTSELQSLMRILYAVLCLKNNKLNTNIDRTHTFILYSSPQTVRYHKLETPT